MDVVLRPQLHSLPASPPPAPASSPESIPVKAVVTTAAPGASAAPAPPERRSLERQVFYMHALARVSRTLATAGTLDELLSQITDYFTELAAVRWTCVYLRDPRTDRFSLRQSTFAVVSGEWAPPRTVADETIGLSRGDLRIPHRTAVAELAGAASNAYVLPLFTEDTPTGFLLLGGKMDGGEILIDEMEFLSTLATQATVAIRHALLLDETARMVEELTILHEISRIFTRGNDTFRGSLRCVWSELQPFLELEWGLLVPLSPEEVEEPLGGAPLDEAERRRIQRWCALLLAEGDRGAQLRKGEVVVLGADEVERSFPARIRPAGGTGLSFAMVPAFYDQQLDAVLLIRALGDRHRLQEHRRLLQHLSPALSSALQKSRDQLKLERLATTDGLTGLYNHRYFHERLQQEYLRAYRLEDRVGLLFVDVDHFKSINDAFGHLHGDQVLARMAEVLRLAVREIDIVARYGGEEFAVILPEASCADAVTVGERVRYAVEQMLPPRLERKIPRLTVSVGAASYPETASSEHELVEAADRALYSAKRAGRNRVRVAGAVASEPET